MRFPTTFMHLEDHIEMNIEARHFTDEPYAHESWQLTLYSYPDVQEAVNVHLTYVGAVPDLLRDTCVYYGCYAPRERDNWCHTHWGLFLHQCTEPGCPSTVRYDDEPYCFTHSPDEGSSRRGWSAYVQAMRNNGHAAFLPVPQDSF